VFVWQATASFLPTFFAEGQGLSPAIASALFSLYFVVHGLTQPLMGGLSDRIGRDSAAIVTMSAGIVGYGLLVVAGSLPQFVAGVLFIGLAMMSWGAPIQSRFMDLLGASERGTGFGLVRTAYMTTGATGSVVVGILADLYGWDGRLVHVARRNHDPRPRYPRGEPSLSARIVADRFILFRRSIIGSPPLMERMRRESESPSSGGPVGNDTGLNTVTAVTRRV